MVGFDKAPNISYLGVFLGALAGHFVRAMWFGPLFGKLWTKYSSWNPEDLKKYGKEKMMRAIPISFVGQIVMTFILAYFLGYMNVSSVFEAVRVAVLIFVGFVATTTMSGFLWHTDKFEFYLINVSANLATTVAMTVVYAAVAL